MIIFDGTHLTSTVSEQELHEFAAAVGLRRDWFQNTGHAAKHPHYDILSERLKDKALKEGAQRVRPTDLARMAWWSDYKRRQRQ